MRPKGDMKQFETDFKDIFSKSSKNLKKYSTSRRFHYNVLDFETNKKVQDFINLMFHCNMIPSTNKPTRVTRHSTNPIDHILLPIEEQATMTLSQS